MMAEIARLVTADTSHARDSANNEQGWPSPIDLAALALREPEPPAFIIPDWLPQGYATLFSGHGGSGKSHTSLQAAVCIALGKDWLGMPVKQRRVIYLSCEDRLPELHWRLFHICRHLSVRMNDLHGKLSLFDLVGRDVILWSPSTSTISRLKAREPSTGTPAYFNLSDALSSYRGEVVVVDGIADTYGGNENVRSEVKAFINALVALIPQDGAVVLIGHVSKGATGDGGWDGYSGSTQWHNAVRARWALYPEFEKGDDGKRYATGDVILELQKGNNSAGAFLGTKARMRWCNEARTFVGELQRSARAEREESERSAILIALAQCSEAGVVVPAGMKGRKNAHNVLVDNGLPKSFPNKRFWRHLEELRQKKLVNSTQYAKNNRHEGVQLLLTAEGENAVASMRRIKSSGECE